jgi:hypothetical protein
MGFEAIALRMTDLTRHVQGTVEPDDGIVVVFIVCKDLAVIKNDSLFFCFFLDVANEIHASLCGEKADKIRAVLEQAGDNGFGRAPDRDDHGFHRIYLLGFSMAGMGFLDYPD